MPFPLLNLKLPVRKLQCHLVNFHTKLRSKYPALIFARVAFRHFTYTLAQ